MAFGAVSLIVWPRNAVGNRRCPTTCLWWFLGPLRSPGLPSAETALVQKPQYDMCPTVPWYGSSTAWRKKESLLCETFLAYHDSIRSDDAASRVEEPAMPGATPPVVPLSEEERLALHTLIRAHKTPQHLSFRAHVILLLAEGLTAPDVARRLGTTRTTVRRWRRHWLKRHGCAIPERLQDALRPGAPATFRAEQGCQIIALACEPPEAS